MKNAGKKPVMRGAEADQGPWSRQRCVCVLFFFSVAGQHCRLLIIVSGVSVRKMISSVADGSAVQINCHFLLC